MPYTYVEPNAQGLSVADDRLRELEAWLTIELTTAISDAAGQTALWRDLMRMYEAIPKKEMRNTPVEDAPNIEVPIGAIACDSIYAQTVDLVFNVSPVLTARAIKAEWTAHAKALQLYINWSAEHEIGLRDAADHTFLDNIQLGTGIFYAPFVEDVRKTLYHTVTRRGPRVFSVPLEDFIVPGGVTHDLQTVPWYSHREWLTLDTLRTRARLRGYEDTLNLAMPAPAQSTMRQQRERLARTTSANKERGLGVYEIHNVYCAFDIDGDGIAEELLVTFDYTSRRALHVRYNPYTARPHLVMRYQVRAHLFYGLGVLEMARPFEEEATEIHVQRILNTILANARIWKGKEGVVNETLKLWPGKFIPLPNPETDLVAEAMADVYPSSSLAEQGSLTLAERRLGVQELSPQRPNAMMGNRTPGITALSLMQQASKRFTPAFDGMRLALSAAVSACLTRYHERLISGDADVRDHFTRVLGEDDGQLVVELLSQRDFHHSVSVGLTASSVTINREADRQNALLLANMLTNYYTRMLQLVGITAAPNVPPAIRAAAEKVATAATELMDRTIRTFEQVRDPATFLVSVEEEINGGNGNGGDGGGPGGPLPMGEGAEGGHPGMEQLLAALETAARGGAAGNGRGSLLGSVPGGTGEEASLPPTPSGP